MDAWVKLPTRWIRENNRRLILPSMKWHGSEKADQIAALMIYIVFVHHAKTYTSADLEDEANEIPVPHMQGEVELSYTQIQNITGLSRAKVSSGLKLLIKHELIYSVQHSSNTGSPLGRKQRYVVVDFGEANGWAKLPKRRLYSSGEIRVFHDLHLRKRAELDALKIYLVVLAFRDRKTNTTKLSYDKIEEYTGVTRVYIKAALSLLIVQNLIQVDKALCEGSDYMNHNVYRARYIDHYVHAGTSAESFDSTAQELASLP